MRRLLALLLTVVILAAGTGFALRLLSTRPGPLPAPTDLVVSRGNLRHVAAALQQQDVIASGDTGRWLFIAAARLVHPGGPLHAAEFHFPAHESIAGVLDILRHARPVQHELTVPEGLTAAQIADLVMRAPILLGSFSVPGEGTVLPETYAFERGTTRSALLARMHDAMQDTLRRLWATRDPTLPLTDPSQLLSLASIVERETALGSERPLVAEVFINRLRLGMRLQSDPTVAYGASGGLGSLPRPLTRSDLLQPSPYNTYVIPGLPPGPISAPGLAAMQAVAHPAHGDLLFFVANGTGGHAFAANLPDHLRNVAVLRSIEAARPGQPATLDPLRPAPQVPASPGSAPP